MLCSVFVEQLFEQFRSLIEEQRSYTGPFLSSYHSILTLFLFHFHFVRILSVKLAIFNQLKEMSSNAQSEYLKTSFETFVLL